MNFFFQQVFAQANEKFNVDAATLEGNDKNGVPQLECITPLRLLLESERNVERWNEEIKDMESHNKIRSQKAQWKSDHTNIVNYLRKRLKFDRCAPDCASSNDEERNESYSKFEELCFSFHTDIL